MIYFFFLCPIVTTGLFNQRGKKKRCQIKSRNKDPLQCGKIQILSLCRVVMKCVPSRPVSLLYWWVGTLFKHCQEGIILHSQKLCFFSLNKYLWACMQHLRLCYSFTIGIAAKQGEIPK